MTTIRVKKLVLVNFKGQKHLVVNFNPDVTYITCLFVGSVWKG